MPVLNHLGVVEGDRFDRIYEVQHFTIHPNPVLLAGISYAGLPRKVNAAVPRRLVLTR